MKKIVLLGLIILPLLASLQSDAQVRVNIQLGAPVFRQSWCGYDDDYYYMPDYGIYYNVRRSMYVYPEGGTWVYAPALPARYGGCSYATSRYFHIRERAPFNRHSFYRDRYRVAEHRSYQGHGFDGGRGRGPERHADHHRRGGGWSSHGHQHGRR